jgi:hypothetical protein
MYVHCFRDALGVKLENEVSSSNVRLVVLFIVMLENPLMWTVGKARYCWGRRGILCRLTFSDGRCVFALEQVYLREGREDAFKGIL